MRIHILLGAALTTILLILTLEPLRWWWCAWIAFMPYLYVVNRYDRPVFHSLVAYGIGLIYAIAATHWVAVYDVNIFVHAIFIGALPISLYFGTLSFSFQTYKQLHVLRIVMPIILWIVLLICTERLSIGSILFEIPFYQPLPFLQLSHFGGMWILVCIVLFVNTTLTLVLLKHSRTNTYLFSTSIIFAIVGWHAGNVALAQRTLQTEGIPITLIQPNFPADDKWKSLNEKYILETYKRLASETAEYKPTIIFFPQYTLPIDVYRNPDFFAELSNRHNTTIVLASYIAQNDSNDIYNVGFLFKPFEGLVHTYNSVTGPPFRDIEQQYGDQFPVVDTPAGHMGFLLCYENAVRWVAEEWQKRDVDFLVSITNTGDFVGTVLPEYHLFQDRLRAIENRKTVVRIAPNGYSAVIDPNGRVIHSSSLDKEEIVQTYIPLYTHN